MASGDISTRKVKSLSTHSLTGPGIFQKLACVKIGDKNGYINQEGEIVINPQFDYARDFSEGLACVKIGDKYGYINQEGEIVINPQFDYARDFSEGLACVKIGDKYGYINQEGEIVINPQFDYARDFQVSVDGDYQPGR